MDFVKSIFERMDLQQIISFLLNGAETIDIDNRTYIERLKNGSSAIYKRLEQLYQDRSELDKAIADLSEALTVHQVVYMEIGMKSGAKIIHQLLHTNGGVELDSTKQE